jgi:aspartate/methionine/tyrosine aminotransferase
MFTATQRASTIQYAIRDVVLAARELEKHGRKVHYLNIGDPLKFDFRTPLHIREALKRAVDEGDNWYAPSEGIPELREEVAAKEKRVNGLEITADDVIITQGISEAIQFIMGAIVNLGDEVLVPGPTYPPYVSYVKFFGGKPIAYRTNEEDQWRVDVDDLERKVSQRTKAIVLVNPNNPTGAVYDRDSVRAVAEFARLHDLLLLSDEIYDQIVFDGKFASTASVVKDYPVVGLNGFSKAFLMTGWRLGYLYFRDFGDRLRGLKDAVARQSRIRLCANTPVQKAGVAALCGPSDHIHEMVGKLRRRAGLASKLINEIRGLSCAIPDGAFYVFPKIHSSNRWTDDKTFVMDLLHKTGVLMVHGSGFDETFGAGHFRAVVLPPENELEEALNLVESFMARG